MRLTAFYVLWFMTTIMFIGLSTIRAQSDVSAAWLQGAGGEGSDIGTSILTDTEGNTYINGSFQGVAYFEDRELVSYGGQDIFLAKYDYAGNLRWLKHAGSDAKHSLAQEHGVDMVISGNYLYVVGVFFGTARFDNIDVQANGSDDIFLAKYTLQGSLVWVRSAGGTQQDFPHALAADEAGNVYLTGLVQGDGQFGGYSFMGQSFFLAKYDAVGNVRWVKYSSDGGSAVGKEVIVKDDGCFVIGELAGMTRFDGTTLRASQPSLFMSKYTLNGDLTWTRNLASASRLSAESFQFGPRGVYIGGSFNGTLQAGGTAYKGTDKTKAFLMRLDLQGNLQWVQTMGGKESAAVKKVTIASDGQVVVVGEFYNDMLFDTTEVSGAGSKDIFIASYSEQGLFNWYDPLGGRGQDNLSDATIAAGHITLVGSFMGDVSYGSYNLQSAGMTDVLMAGMNLRAVDDHTRNSSNRVAFYLNPSQSEIIVESADLLDVVHILDMSGKIILEKALEHEYNARLGIKALPPGTYVVWTSSKERIKSADFLIQR